MRVFWDYNKKRVKTAVWLISLMSPYSCIFYEKFIWQICNVYWWISPKLSAQQLIRWSFCSRYLWCRFVCSWWRLALSTLFIVRKLKKSWMQEMIMRSLASLICHLNQARYSSLHVSLPERDAIAITIAVALPVWYGNASEDWFLAKTINGGINGI